jgi:hypothetical protein
VGSANWHGRTFAWVRPTYQGGVSLAKVGWDSA